jgi:LCP family protein required for cell wall assembly
VKKSLPTHATLLASHKVRRAVGMAVTGLLAFGGAGGATAAFSLTHNIDSVNTNDVLTEADRPDDPLAGAALNIVLMGEDSRDGDNIKFASKKDTGGARSDTTMILHISTDRSRAELISIPRDSTVNIPACNTTNGKTTAPWNATKFNAAFAQGYDTGGTVADGALCAMTTIESLTGVRMDGFIVVDFQGFANMINALGGVEICIPNEIISPDAGNLHLQPGLQTLKGKKALQYARARKGTGLGDGSDLGRIGRQQELMAAIAREVLSKNLLTDSPALLKFLGATTSSLTMSSNLASVTGLAGLAYSMRNVRPSTITFTTVPYTDDPNNKANVMWTADAAQLWDNLKWDRPLDSTDSGTAANDGTTPADSTATSAATDAPSADASATADAGTSADAGSGADAGASATPTSDPSPTTTAKPGKDSFTANDVTSVCN